MINKSISSDVEIHGFISNSFSILRMVTLFQFIFCEGQTTQDKIQKSNYKIIVSNKKKINQLAMISQVI